MFLCSYAKTRGYLCHTCTIDIQVVIGFKIWTHFLGSYTVRKVFQISITQLMILRAFRIKQNVHISVWKRGPGLSKTDLWLLTVTDIAEYLVTLKLRIWSHQKNAVSSHSSTLTEKLALHCHCQTILVTLVTKTPWVKFCTGSVALHREQALSQKVFLRRHTHYI